MEENAKKIDKRIIKIAFYAAWFIYWLYIAWNIPYLADDWNWGSNDGITQLLHGTVNHRYFGNLMVVLLTRNVFLKTFIVALVICLLVYVMNRYVLKVTGNNENELINYCFIMLMILIMGSKVWAETIGWISGFCNYVVSALFVVTYIYLYECIDDGYKIKNKALKALLFIFSVCSMLCVENISLLVFALSLFTGLRYLIKKNLKEKSDVIIILAGNAVGFVIMFVNKFMGDLLMLGYQSAFDDQYMHAGRELLYNSSNSMNENLQIFKERFIYLVKIVFYSEKVTLYVLLGAIVLFAALYKWVKSGKGLIKRMVYLLMVGIVSIVPFLVVLLTGFRVVFHQYLMVVLIISIIFVSILDVNKKYNVVHMGISGMVIMLVLTYVFFVFVDYGIIGRTDRKQKQAIEECINNNTKELYLPMYDEDVSQYLWRVYDFEDEYLNKYMREFYNISDDVGVYYYSE